MRKLTERAEPVNGREIGKEILHIALACAVSTFFYLTGLGLPLFILPLLLVALYHGKKGSLIAFAVETAGLVLWNFIGNPLYEAVPDIALPLITIELYIPLSLSAAGVIWILTSGKRIEARLGLSILPAVLFIVLTGIVTGRDTALSLALTEHYGNVFETLLTMLLGEAPGEEFMAIFMDIFIQVTMSLAVPMSACFACASFFIYETSRHSRETDWELKVRSLELDGRIIWGLIFSIAGVILMRFVKLPPAIGSVLFSAAILLSMLYFIQGFSVVSYWIGKRTDVKSSTLFTVLIMILLLAQGINIILFLAISITGMAETFFDLRR